MEHKPRLQYGGYYHIYNRGTNRSPLFIEDVDFEHFIDVLKGYTHSVADTLSYAMMLNHFHLAIHIKPEDEIGYLKPENWEMKDPRDKWKTYFPEGTVRQDLCKPIPLKMYSHAFNAYAKWFNHKYNRSGKLFEDRFERKELTSENQLRRLVVYINSNPEHHNVESNESYRWTSYHALIGGGKSWLDRDYVMELFGDVSTFLAALSRVDFDNMPGSEF